MPPGTLDELLEELERVPEEEAGPALPEEGE